MGESETEALGSAVRELNRGNVEAALKLCSDTVIFNVGQSPGRPSTTSYIGKSAICELWRETFESLNGAFEIQPGEVLTGNGYLVMFLNLKVGSGSQRVEKRLILTGTSEPSGLWTELWLQFDDQPLQQRSAGRSGS